MARIKLAILRSTKAKDGSYKIRLAIGHKSETHYIVTRFSVPSLSNFRNGTIIGTPTAHHDNLKLRQILTDYEDRLDRIPNLSELSPVELRDKLKNMRPSTHTSTILEQIEKQIANKLSDGRTITFILHLKKCLSDYIGDIALQDITPATIEGFHRHMRNSKYANATINSNMQQLRKVINDAIRDNLVRYDTHPFSYWHALPIPFRDIDISVEDMRKIANYHANDKTDISRDIFMLSYYLGGINLIDLANINFSSCNGILDYVRHKTKNTSNVRVQISIHPMAQAIIDKYIGTDGHLHFGKLKTFNTLSLTVNREIKIIGQRLNIHRSGNLAYYTARKSFVQHGFDLGISLDVIEYCIGHTSGHSRTIYNYMRVMRRHADEAIRKIIGNLHQTNEQDGDKDTENPAPSSQTRQD